jgi:hypothetical protein
MRGAWRYGEERRRYSITCTSSVLPAANDHDRPRRLFQVGSAIYGPNYANLPLGPRHPRTNKRFSELEPTSFLSALYVPISKHFAKVFKPTDPISPYYDETLDEQLVLNLRRGDFDQHCWNFTEHSSGYNCTTVLTSFRTASASLLASQRRNVLICT